MIYFFSIYASERLFEVGVLQRVVNLSFEGETVAVALIVWASSKAEGSRDFNQVLSKRNGAVYSKNKLHCN